MSHVASIALISTGGTIEKTYHEFEGIMSNRVSVLDIMISGLQLTGIELTRIPLMNIDSLEMTPADHEAISTAVAGAAKDHDGVVIVHGTDRLAVTGEQLIVDHPQISIPIVLTGAMRPYMLRTTDAMQNLTEALLAVQFLDPGVYVAMHNSVLAFPGVHKDQAQLRFVKD
jgi:L-asparaginase